MTLQISLSVEVIAANVPWFFSWFVFLKDNTWGVQTPAQGQMQEIIFMAPRHSVRKMTWPSCQNVWTSLDYINFLKNKEK